MPTQTGNKMLQIIEELKFYIFVGLCSAMLFISTACPSNSRSIESNEAFQNYENFIQTCALIIDP